MHPVTTRRGYLSAIGASGVAALTGVGTARARTATITLGGSMSLSGETANLGRLYRDAYRLTIERINDSGGVDAGDGNSYALEMVLLDDESDAEKSRSIYRELVDRRNVDYLLGPYSSTVTLAASEIAAERRRPMVEGSGASPEIFGGGNEWVFGLLPPADTYTLSTIDMARAQDQPPDSAALLTEDDTFSRSSAAGARQKLDDAGIDVVVDEAFASDTSDLSAPLRRVRDREAEMVVLSAHERHAIALVDGMARLNVSPKLVMATVGTLTASFREQTGDNGDYVYGPSPWNDAADFDDPVYGSTGAFVETTAEAFGYRPDYHSAAGAAVIETFQRAFESADELTPTNVRDAIRKIEFTTAYGDVSFGEEGFIDRDMVVYQWQPQDGGEADDVVVWPPSARQSAPIYPMPNWSERRSESNAS
ncbi:MAG: amino acid ABC transporter substrate-binding protein [Salinigranum sp.]